MSPYREQGWGRAQIHPQSQARRDDELCRAPESTISNCRKQGYLQQLLQPGKMVRDRPGHSFRVHTERSLRKLGQQEQSTQPVQWGLCMREIKPQAEPKWAPGAEGGVGTAAGPSGPVQSTQFPWLQAWPRQLLWHGRTSGGAGKNLVCLMGAQLWRRARSQPSAWAP